MRKKPRLIVAASEQCADLFYASGFFAPDPFAWVECAGTTRLLLSDLEMDRGRDIAKVDGVDSLSEMERKLVAKGVAIPGYPEVLAFWLRHLRVRSVQVPGSFPLGLATRLEKLGIALEAVDGSFWKERERKSKAEIQAIQKALRITECGMARGMEVLRQSISGKGKKLTWGGAGLTSERLRAEIDTAVLRAGGVPGGTIVAGGNQACDPHERGSGPLRAGELIILDIFPRSAASGFFGDLTRTVVRGVATEAQRVLWHTCLEGQEFALRSVAPGRDGKAVHEELRRRFADAGYPTELQEGRWRGFFHGTGHGLGLEIHEPPRFAATRFLPGQVLTVEPGIYWPGVGGVRHEDVVAVTETGSKLLSRFPKPFEI